MVEKKLKIWVIAMMVVAGIYGFDTYFDAAGVTGYVVNSAISSDCTDSDNNDIYATGITSSEIYANGYAEDTCAGDDLLEFYCSSKGPDVRAVHCNYGCFAGACN